MKKFLERSFHKHPVVTVNQVVEPVPCLPSLELEIGTEHDDESESTISDDSSVIIATVSFFPQATTAVTRLVVPGQCDHDAPEKNRRMSDESIKSPHSSPKSSPNSSKKPILDEFVNRQNHYSSPKSSKKSFFDSKESYHRDRRSRKSQSEESEKGSVRSSHKGSKKSIFDEFMEAEQGHGLSSRINTMLRKRRKSGARSTTLELAEHDDHFGKLLSRSQRAQENLNKIKATLSSIAANQTFVQNKVNELRGRIDSLCELTHKIGKSIKHTERETKDMKMRTRIQPEEFEEYLLQLKICVWHVETIDALGPEES